MNKSTENHITQFKMYIFIAIGNIFFSLYFLLFLPMNLLETIIFVAIIGVLIVLTVLLLYTIEEIKYLDQIKLGNYN